MKARREELDLLGYNGQLASVGAGGKTNNADNVTTTEKVVDGIESIRVGISAEVSHDL